MKFSEAIARMEGYYRPGKPSVAKRLHNPGNLVYARQRGAVPHIIRGADGKDRIYAQFPAPEDGWAALERQLALYAKRGLTVRESIFKWAPASDGNDPGSYLSFVCKAVECEPSQLLSEVL